MNILKTVLTGIKKSPGKTSMTLLAVGLGVAVLISSLNISSIFTRFMEEEITSGGLIINAANAEFSDEGGLDRIRPSQFDDKVMDIITNEVPGVSAVSPATIPFWDLELRAEGTTYRVRSILGVNQKYPELMDLSLHTGEFFNETDVSSGAKKAVVSRDLAERIFGSAEAAIGKTIRPPQSNEGQAEAGGSGGPAGEGSKGGDSQGGGFSRRMAPPSYEIRGVFETPTELKRKSFGIGDALVPYTSLLPAGFNVQMAAGFLLSTLTISAEGTSSMALESHLREVLGREYGDELTLHVWEGTPGGGEAVLEEARESLKTVTVVINLLGFILLVTGSIGILSIMIVEVAGRSREIAMKRALGAHKGILIKEFWLRGVVLSLLSSALGVVLSLILLNPLKDLVVPIFADIHLTDISTVLFQPGSALIGVAAAVLFGGSFGIFPVFSALKTNIAQGIREV
jgi:putative ABC transport system permease protein